MKTYKLQATPEQIAQFAKWCWDWFEYDPVTVDDESFRTMAQIVWQLHEQLETEEN